ncbi:hypothetical protein C8Q73DRAFT_657824, partial [Cubamyces lactineus]
PEGCARCGLPSSPVCCILCSPSHPAFDFLLPSSATALRPPALRAARVESTYAMEATDMRFREALHKLRRAETLKRYGHGTLHNDGPGLVMGDNILDCIADSACAHKLGTTSEDLFRQCKWDMAWDLGGHVLRLAAEYVTLAYCWQHMKLTLADFIHRCHR